jgi:hypothetical protein
MLHWSGTGNSRACAEMAAEHCASRSLPCRVAHLDSDLSGLERGQATLIGVFVPTHGFTAPWAAIAGTMRLPWGRGSPTLVGACGGALDDGGSGFLPGFTGTAAWVIALALSLRGYRVRSVLPLDMPANWLLGPLFPDEGFRLRLAPGARSDIGKALARLFGGNAAFPPRGLAHLAIGLLLLPLSAVYLLAVRFVLSQLMFADASCDACGACQSGCRLGALRLRGRKKRRPDWSLACQSCMRCASSCPRGAIHQSLAWTLAAAWLAVGAAPAVARRLVSALWELAPFIPYGLSSAAAAFAAMLLGARLSGVALRVLARVTPIAELLRRSSPTYYLRRGGGRGR